MEKIYLIQKIRMFIADLGWKMFIWGNDFTEEQYWEMIYRQEKNHHQSNDIDD